MEARSRHHADLPTISRNELHEKLTRGDRFFLFEVLPRMYWRKHHLPTAINLPPDRLAEVIAEAAPEKDAEIVLYCWDFG